MLLSAVAFAQSTPPDELVAVPNRPTISNTAETTQRGVLELEYGTELSDPHKDLNGLLKFGATRDLELRLSSFPVIADHAAGVTGVGDVQLGIKYRLLHQTANRPTISLSYTAELPTATGALGTAAVDHFALLMISKDLGKHHVDFNVQPAWWGRPHAAGYDTNWTLAGAWSHPIRGNWGIGGELSGYTRQDVSTPGELQTILNATYTARPRLVLDFGVINRIYGNVPRAMFEAGFTYSLADLYRRPHRAQVSPGSAGVPPAAVRASSPAPITSPR